jgi:hypothetical protein
VVIFYIAAGIGIVLSVVYLAVGTLSFLRIRRELLSGNDLELSEALRDDKGTSEFSAVDVVPGFAWKATVAVVTSFVALVLASFSGIFWYVLALSGLGTAAAVIVAFVLELRNDRSWAVGHETVVAEA